MALVQGEDTESDEEINTDQLHTLAVSPDGSLSGLSSQLSAQAAAKAGIVMGEESETDDEDEGGEGSLEQTDSGGGGTQSGDRLSVPPLSGQSGSASPGTESPRRSSLDSTSSAQPQSLLHKKLRESNVSLRRSIVERVLKLYHVTSRNLTIVNDNLSRAQGIVEKVNTQLKRSDNELAKLNSIMEQVSTDSQTFALNINIEVTPSPKKSRSPALLHKLRQQQGKVPGLPSFFRNPSHDSSAGIEQQVLEARPEGKEGGSTPPKPS